MVRVGLGWLVVVVGWASQRRNAELCGAFHVTARLTLLVPSPLPPPPPPCSLKAPIAMGYVKSAFAAVGSAVEVEVRGKRQGAVVAKMPFVPHNYFKA